MQKFRELIQPDGCVFHPLKFSGAGRLVSYQILPNFSILFDISKIAKDHSKLWSFKRFDIFVGQNVFRSIRHLNKIIALPKPQFIPDNKILFFRNCIHIFIRQLRFYIPLFARINHLVDWEIISNPSIFKHNIRLRNIRMDHIPCNNHCNNNILDLYLTLQQPSNLKTRFNLCNLYNPNPKWIPLLQQSTSTLHNPNMDLRYHDPCNSFQRNLIYVIFKTNLWSWNPYNTRSIHTFWRWVLLPADPC